MVSSENTGPLNFVCLSGVRFRRREPPYTDAVISYSIMPRDYLENKQESTSSSKVALSAQQVAALFKFFDEQSVGHIQFED